MKVVHVASSLVRKSAGVREVILGLARQQSVQGVEVFVLGLDHPDWTNEAEEWDCIKTQVVSVKGPRAFGYAPSMTSALRALDPDIVHLHGLWMHPGRSVLKWHRATRRPYVVSPHGMLSEVALSYGSLKKRAVSLWFQDAVFREAAVIHATSDAEKDEIRRYGIEAHVCVIPNGISDIEMSGRGRSATKSRGRTVLSLGRIHKKKALDQLILAWQSLEQDFPDWSLLIVGPEEQNEAQILSSMINDFRLKRAEIRGPVFGDEKAVLMGSAGIFALPTRSENFAVTVAESLILKVPVVSSHGAPWAGLETEGCGLWVPFGAEAMADALRKLMALSDAERLAMGERGRAWMKRDFSWASVSHKFQDCYTKEVPIKR